MKTAIATDSTRLPPNRSPSQPDAEMNTARLTRKQIATLATDVAGIWKLRPIVGSATLTIVESMTVMNIAATCTTLTATFWVTRLVMPYQRRTARTSQRNAAVCGGASVPSRAHRRHGRALTWAAQARWLMALPGDRDLPPPDWTICASPDSTSQRPGREVSLAGARVPLAVAGAARR